MSLLTELHSTLLAYYKYCAPLGLANPIVGSAYGEISEHSGLRQWFLGVILTLLVFAVLHLMTQFKWHKVQEEPPKGQEEAK